ncbi:HAD-IIB family hydrolase [Coleofasciculus sp. FACHB-1120]|uniref:HAD family hydrolase n=1 Tax=Coleofasciculus sp. FACHB-1120 TaxID=2692783 RepID=UPI001F54C1D7|nr:HAD-IIB family hydrolase [Coleofasciculus sp. FACHB-1120]
MRYLALATDYDGTLASDGRVNEDTLEALERLSASGRKLILVTGRELDDLLHVFPQIDRFDRVVAENGALLYQPATREEKRLGDRPAEAFIKMLRDSEALTCQFAVLIPSPSDESSLPPGIPTKLPSSKRSATWDWICKSS